MVRLFGNLYSLIISELKAETFSCWFCVQKMCLRRVLIGLFYMFSTTGCFTLRWRYIELKLQSMTGGCMYFVRAYVCACMYVCIST